MKSTTKIIIGVVIGLLLAVGTIAFLNGWITVSRDTHPPCDQSAERNRGQCAAFQTSRPRRGD